MRHLDLENLQRKVEQLIEDNDELQEQNTAMRVNEARWQAERSKLIQQNEIARKKVNEMIERLQMLEKNNH